jgi:hypothetical protein
VIEGLQILFELRALAAQSAPFLSAASSSPLSHTLSRPFHLWPPCRGHFDPIAHNDKYILTNDKFQLSWRQQSCSIAQRALELWEASPTPKAAMKRSSTVFLQIVIVLVGLGALAFLVWEPQIEGRNEHATQFEIYFKDPFLALVYAGSIPFFIALYQAIKVLGYVGRNNVFSPEVVAALRTIKYCALAIIGFVVVEEIVILLMSNGDNDNPGAPIFLGVLIIFPSIVVATAAAMFARILQNAVDLKSENDLTV